MFAIFKAWPSEQNRVAATHLLPVPELKWAKEEGGLFYENVGFESQKQQQQEPDIQPHIVQQEVYDFPR